MKKGYTHITFLLDRTGSMSVVKDDTIKGFNKFLKEQKELEGKATMLLAQFDSIDPFEVVEDFSDIKKVKLLNDSSFKPRDYTPLLDSIARGINHTEAKINEMRKKDRPEVVIVTILTDGQENASTEFKREDVKELIERKNKDGWKFIFLSAELESIKDAGYFGIPKCNTVSYSNDSKGVSNTYSAVNCMVTRYRTGVDN